MPKLRSTYNGRLIYITTYEERTIHSQNCKIVWDGVCLTIFLAEILAQVLSHCRESILW